MGKRSARAATALAVASALALLGACDAGSGSAGPTAAGSPSAGAPVTAAVTTVATGLHAPWGLARLSDGRFLVTLRDDAALVVVDPHDGSVTKVGGAGADDLRAQTRHEGESGLLGVAVAPDDDVADGEATVYLYRTGAQDNAVVRASLAIPADGAPTLGPPTTILGGIHKADHHDGGRLAFGPQGRLYVTTGDAGDRPSAQDPASLNGKILRITTDGDPAPGNPDPASPVWSLGHRNVEGIGWDADGRMFASEFGQSTWDELNQIEPGRNYGWPKVEGFGTGTPAATTTATATATATASGTFTPPLVTWPTDQASPSGLAVVPGDAVYLAALHGERLWRVPFAPSSDHAVPVLAPQALVTDQGRLRSVVADRDGSLWVLTNNTDGRGNPRTGDDRLLHVVVTRSQP